METLIQLAGAVAFLLWGIRTVRTGVERLFGARIEALMRRLTDRRPLAAGLGAGAALALQSATAVVLMAASFRAAGILALPGALAITAGAEFGSSLAASLLSLNLRLLGPILLFAGYLVFTRSAGRSGKHIGRILLGFGFVLSALSLLSGAAGALRESPETQEIMAILAAKPTVLVLGAALLTWAVHSSIAVVLMAVHLAGVGGVGADAGLWMVLGANLGAALPAVTGGWSIGPKARQVLLGALTLRLVAACLGAVAFGVPALRALEPVRWATSDPILAHLSLNLFVVLVALPFVVPAARLLEAAAPDREPPKPEGVQGNIFLAPQDVSDPNRAFLNISNETLRVSHIVFGMISQIAELFQDSEAEARIRRLDDDVDELHRQTTLYLASMKLEDLDEAQRRRWFELFEFITHLEHVGDVITTNITALAKRKRKTGLEFSREGAAEIEALTVELGQIFRHSQAVFLSGDSRQAAELINAKRRYREQSRSSQRRHAMRLCSGVPRSMETSRIHLDLLRDLQRINSHLSAIAYLFVESRP